MVSGIFRFGLGNSIFFPPLISIMKMNQKIVCLFTTSLSFSKYKIIIIIIKLQVKEIYIYIYIYRERERERLQIIQGGLVQKETQKLIPWIFF